MPDLLIELFSEEIPARMQAKAADDLKGLVTNGLVDAGLTYESAAAFATPRRLALTVEGVTARSPDIREEKKGPRITAPAPALHGFFRSVGLTPQGFSHADTLKPGEAVDFSDMGLKIEVRGEGDKAIFFALSQKPGRAAEEIIAGLMPDVIRGFPWPKSQRWGSGSLRWVRPLHSIVCTFGTDIEEPAVIAFDVDGITSGNATHGHRFLAPETITVKRFSDYVEKLGKAKVVLDPARRRDTILHEAKQLAFAAGLELVEDEGLLNEVAGLVEWPVVLMGGFDADFLAVPDEVIRATIRANQKCFVLKDPKTGRLANRFILTSNMAATDGGATIVAGNERVIRARLSDAKFFWDSDLAPLPGYTDKADKPLDQRLEKLKALGVVFHEKLGTQWQRIERIAALAVELAPIVGADPKKAERAAFLSKADLMTEVVGEFPEVQGLMGRYYAAAQGEDPEVAAAIEEHWKPQGPSDRVPTAPVSIAVALADKLDTLVGFWAIDEKPTGSKDPYALRRAALGVIRVVLENGVRLPLGSIAAKVPDLLSFFADRLKVQLREQGNRFDLVDAVFALGGQDDLLLIVKRVEALGSLLDTEDGKNLLAGYKRAANILKAEEKKGTAIAAAVDPARLSEPEEIALANAVANADGAARQAVTAEDFEGAMKALASLRAPVDAFFDKVLVNDADDSVRANRLKLLSVLRDACHEVADFSRIEG